MVFEAIGFVVPIGVTYPTFDEDQPPLFEMLLADQPELPGYQDSMPRDAFLPHPGSIDIGLVGREREVHDWQAAGGLTNLRIPPEIADDQRSIQRHGDDLFHE